MDDTPVSSPKGVWAWFVERAHGPHAMFWLMVCAFLDPIFFPIAPEIYLAALMLAKPDYWRRYLAVAIATSTAGAAVGYAVGAWVFAQFGASIISFSGLEQQFVLAQQEVGQNVFTTMLLVPFTLVPEKVFVLAAGFLGAPFLIFLLGFFLGRSVRISLITFLVYKFGEHILRLVQRYMLVATLVLFALLCVYGIVHWHLFPW